MQNHPYSTPAVRNIWGKADTILLIFAGAAAEFALNKSVDWLYFTGRLPADPLGRLFSTVAYARDIIFSPEDEANMAIDRMGNIHSGVEQARGTKIPDWAYRDVLFMLIYYSLASYELLEKKLTRAEKEEVVRVFLNVGERMKINGLPQDYTSWWLMYQQQIREDLRFSTFTADLFRQYRKHLGPVRYRILIEAQKALVTPHVHTLLGFKKPHVFGVLAPMYKAAKVIRLDKILKMLLLPPQYKQRISMLDRQHT